MKLTLPWISDRSMRALFSNVTTTDPNIFILLMVFHKSRKGGFDRILYVDEANRMLAKANQAYVLEPQE